MRLIDADELKKLILAERDKIPEYHPSADYEIGTAKRNLHGDLMRGGIRKALRCLEQCKTVDAVPVVQYKALRNMYYELREAFIDYVCTGSGNLAPYCLNRCPGCVDKRGWCITLSDKCQGFNPAEILLEDRMDGDGDA